jgi:hypothetical protein
MVEKQLAVPLSGDEAEGSIWTLYFAPVKPHELTSYTWTEHNNNGVIKCNFAYGTNGEYSFPVLSQYNPLNFAVKPKDPQLSEERVTIPDTEKNQRAYKVCAALLLRSKILGKKLNQSSENRTTT